MLMNIWHGHPQDGLQRNSQSEKASPFCLMASQCIMPPSIDEIAEQATRGPHCRPEGLARPVQRKTHCCRGELVQSKTVLRDACCSAHTFILYARHICMRAALIMALPIFSVKLLVDTSSSAHLSELLCHCTQH